MGFDLGYLTYYKCILVVNNLLGLAKSKRGVEVIRGLGVGIDGGFNVHGSRRSDPLMAPLQYSVLLPLLELATKPDPIALSVSTYLI